MFFSAMIFINEFNEGEITHGLTNFIRSLIGKIVFIKDFIKPARKPQAFKPGDEWRPERSVGNPAKPGSPKETLDFIPGSFIFNGFQNWTDHLLFKNYLILITFINNPCQVEN